MLKNLKSFDNYLVEGLEDFEINENSIEFESDDEKEVYLDGDLFEAMAPKLTAKERQNALAIGALMREVNKDESYKAAKEKFITIFKKVAKKVVQEKKMKPMVLKKLNKISLKNI